MDPILLPVDNSAVTGTSFRADWTNGGDVSSYTLQVNRIALPDDDEATLLMTENFSKVNAYSDGYTDVSESLDDYTDNPGWSGLKLYPAAGKSLKVGTGSVIGYLVSPELPLRSTVSVVFNAKNWISSSGKSDNSTIAVECGSVKQNIVLTDSPQDYTVVLRGCEASNIKLTMTVAGKRFYVYNVNIYNGDVTAEAKGPRRMIVEEGDSTWRMVSGITDTCYTVKALAGGTFEYLVKAIYLDGTESPWSNIKHVTLTGVSDVLFGDVNGDNEVNVADVTALINIILNGIPADLAVTDLTGDHEVNVADVTLLISYILSH